MYHPNAECVVYIVTMKLCSKWYQHSSKSVEENGEVKLFWDFQSNQTVKSITGGQKKKAKETIIVAIAVLVDSNEK